MLTLVPNQTWPYLEERCFFVGPAEEFFGTVHLLSEFQVVIKRTVMTSRLALKTLSFLE